MNAEWTPALLPARRIAGIALRTYNAEAFQTIPPHWQRFGAEPALQQRVAAGAEVFAVYGRFENLDCLATEGISALRYTLLIGVELAANEPVPAGLEVLELPAQRAAVFAVPGGEVQQVGACWQAIWQRQDLDRAFVADHEHYRGDGRIEIAVGLR